MRVFELVVEQEWLQRPSHKLVRRQLLTGSDFCVARAAAIEVETGLSDHSIPDAAKWDKADLLSAQM